MNTEARLRALEIQYLISMSAIRAAKAMYLATRRDSGATSRAAMRTRMLWQTLLAQKHAILAQVGELEDTDTAG